MGLRTIQIKALYVENGKLTEVLVIMLSPIRGLHVLT
jgi:hypothetical protein